jgi:selT/selW/selH-like putative selenoprotein
MNINPFEDVGVGRPNIWNWVMQNKIYAALMTFFLANMFETQLLSTGAFEIYFNDVPVWSKLQTGRIPSPPELLQIVDNHLKLLKNVNDFDDLSL